MKGGKDLLYINRAMNGPTPRHKSQSVAPVLTTKTGSHVRNLIAGSSIVSQMLAAQAYNASPNPHLLKKKMGTNLNYPEEAMNLHLGE